MITPGAEPGRFGTVAIVWAVGTRRRPSGGFRGRSAGQRCGTAGAEPTAVERARQPTGGERSDTRSGSGAPRRSGSSSAGRDGRVDAAGERPTGTPRRLRPAGGSTPGSADPGGSTPPRRRPRPRRGHPPLWWRLIAVQVLVLLTMISRLPHGRLATGATFTAAAPSGAMSGSEAAIASAVSAGA
jgi:hypothetical protein